MIRVEFVQRQIDAMIRDAILGKIPGTNCRSP